MFVCTHTLGSVWKQAFGAAPWWVKQVMDNGMWGERVGGGSGGGGGGGGEEEEGKGGGGGGEGGGGGGGKGGGGGGRRREKGWGRGGREGEGGGRGRGEEGERVGEGGKWWRKGLLRPSHPCTPSPSLPSQGLIGILVSSDCSGPVI